MRYVFLLALVACSSPGEVGDGADRHGHADTAAHDHGGDTAGEDTGLAAPEPMDAPAAGPIVAVRYCFCACGDARRRIDAGEDVRMPAMMCPICGGDGIVDKPGLP
jgi:hypothetical protein